MATAPPQPAAASLDPVELCALVSSLARRHRIGTVGLVGTHAAAIGTHADPVELFVTVSFAKAEAFACALAEATNYSVHLYTFHLVPWAHPHHLCVRWVNVDQIPTTRCPRGAVTRWKITRDGRTFEAAVRLDSVPHFCAATGYVPTPPDECIRMFGPPPLGGFLI